MPGLGLVEKASSSGRRSGLPVGPCTVAPAPGHPASRFRSRSAQVTVPFSLQEVSPWPLSPTTYTETVRDWGPPWCFPLSQQRGPPPSGEHVWTRVIAFGAEPLGGVALGSRPATGSCCPEMETE